MLYALRDQNIEKTILEYHNDTLQKIVNRFDVESPSTKITKKGKNFYAFADSFTYRNLVQSLRMQDDDNLIRTIHKAKGGEFPTVLIVIEEKNLKHLFEPKIN